VDGQQSLSFAAVVLSAARALVDGINGGVVARGFDGMRPAHGFAFARIAPYGATVREIADHLGVTKQAASQLVDELLHGGYVVRRPHPTDARARLIVLTDKGWASTRAAEAAAADVVRAWAGVLGEQRIAQIGTDLARVAPMTGLRPTW
jgi:DNA-binding MarR family transcriptional regulator